MRNLTRVAYNMDVHALNVMIVKQTCFSDDFLARTSIYVSLGSETLCSNNVTGNSRCNMYNLPARVEPTLRSVPLSGK